MVIREVITSVFNQSAQVALELPSKRGPARALEDQITRAREQFAANLHGKEIGVVLGVDIAAFFAKATVILGICDGFRQVLERTLKTAGEIQQPDAYELVDLWGRIQGVQAMLEETGEELELLCSEGVRLVSHPARLASVLIQLGRVTRQIGSKAVQLRCLASVAPLMDNVAATLELELKGRLTKELELFMDDLNA